MSKKNLVILFALLFGIYGYSSINIGLPAFPGLQHYFNTDASLVKLSMTLFLFGYAASQLFWGTISDRYGRLKVILLASIITIIGSLVTALAPSIFVFIAGRFIEAIGAGFTPVMGRAILADSLDEKSLQNAMSYLVAIVAIMPAVAPVVGGQILQWFNWQAIYYLLALLGMLLLIPTSLKLKETHTNTLTILSFRQTMTVYREILWHRQFMGYFLPYSLMLSGLITFYAIAPYIFITHLHIGSNKYGYILMLSGVAYFFGSAMNQVLAYKLSSNKILLAGFLIALVSCLTFLISLFTHGINIATVIIPMMTYAISCGFISPPANARAMSVVPKNKGTAAALLGAGVMVFSSIFTASLATVRMDSLLPLTIFISSLTIASLAIFLFMIKHEHS